MSDATEEPLEPRPSAAEPFEGRCNSCGAMPGVPHEDGCLLWAKDA